MFSVFGYLVTVERFVLAWFLFVVAVVGWVILRSMLGISQRIRQIGRQKIVADVSIKAIGAASSTKELKAQYGPILSSNLNIAQTWLTPHFSFVGRTTRKQYLLTQIISGVGLGITLLIAARLLDSWSSLSQGTGTLMIVVAVALVCWVVLATSAKRMRDTGVTVWWALTLLIPPLNIAAMAFLLLVPSDEFAGRGL
jgi:uncharacterized membrane protein YhaH (DUF805 family)